MDTCLPHHTTHYPTPALPGPPPHPTRTRPSPTPAPLPLLPPSPSLPPTLDIHHRHTHHVPCSGCSGQPPSGPAARGNSRGPPLLPTSVQCIQTETWETWIMVGEGARGEEGRREGKGGEVGRAWILINGYQFSGHSKRIQYNGSVVLRHRRYTPNIRHLVNIPEHGYLMEKEAKTRNAIERHQPM